MISSCSVVTDTQSNAVEKSILPCCIAFCQNGMCALGENGRAVDLEDVIG